MERLGPDLDRELRRLGPGPGMPALVAAWPSAVGDTIARNAWPARIGRDGTLVVHTSSSTWAFELTQLASNLLDRLAETLPAECPTGVRFVPGRVPEPPAPPATEPRRPPINVGSEERRRAGELAEAIADDELRERVARAAELSLAQTASSRSF
jgi:predicted nucleic acid-binding Zn ribbon protein